MKVLNFAGYPSLTGLFFTFKSTRIPNNVENRTLLHSHHINTILEPLLGLQCPHKCL
jgi:hypothetical protein